MNGQIEIGGITPSRYFFSIAVVLGLLFAMTSGDNDLPVWLVGLQWQLQSVIPMALLIGAHMLLLRSTRFTGMNRWLTLLASGLLGGTLFAPIALVIDLWLDPTLELGEFAAELPSEWLAVVPPVALCWIALNVPWQLGYRLQKHGADSDARQSSAANGTPEFVSLLPTESRGQVLMLKSELHYLQVVTDNGRGLILFNLADAADQLGDEAGMLVHRSYWVAFDAIDRLVRKGRQGELRLHNGTNAPVSRNRLAELNRRLEGRAQAGPGVAQD
jgi:hypothetical protein